MGLDGSNYLTICGPQKTLDTIEQTRLKLTDEEVSNDRDTIYLMKHYFNEDNSKLIRAPKQLNQYGKQSSNVLQVSFYFRNIHPPDFFIALLKKYPDCHIKNEYNTETGDSVIWIGYIDQDGSTNIQNKEWVDIVLHDMELKDGE